MKYLRKLLSQIKNAAAGWRSHLLFGFGWAIVVSICVSIHFTGKGWQPDRSLGIIIAIYFCGSMVGGYLALWLSAAFANRRAVLARFAYFFVVLCGLTLGSVLFIFVVQHRIYFTQWHADLFTVTWAYQFIFTTLGSIYLFLITGLRPLLPYGVIALFFASLCFSRGWLNSSR